MPKKKVLILTASPRRDKPIDEMIARELRGMGMIVWVKPCVRQGRAAVLKYKPNVVVLPPIRQVYSRDFVEQIKRFGCGIVSRHTEPSCDWQDFKAIDADQKSKILGQVPYYVDVEIVWSQDEAEILNRRPTQFKTVPVGCLAVDKYLDDKIRKKYTNRRGFNRKHKFSSKKRTILIQSPWGFADSAPDLRIDETEAARKDMEGQKRHLQMIRHLKENIGNHFNMIVTIHPDCMESLYEKDLKELGLPLDTTSTSLELMANCDVLIHSGSTMAVGAHFLNMPAFQFGDVNLKDAKSWWSRSGEWLSKVSPRYEKMDNLMEAMEEYNQVSVPLKSNANKEAIEYLEKGRFGRMDGKATVRTAQIIAGVNGKFGLFWPESGRDYSQLTILKDLSTLVNQALCPICKKKFYIIKDEWVSMLAKRIDAKAKMLTLKHGRCCPNCGTRYFSDTFKPLE